MENKSITTRTAQTTLVPTAMEESIATRTAQTALVPTAMEESIAAMASPMIRHADPAELDRVMMAAVYRAFRDKGQKADPDDMQHIVDSLAPTALRICPNIRLQEVPLAISDGVFGEYGEYFGLNVHTFISFLKARYYSQKRAEAARRALPPEPEKKIPTEEELLEMGKKTLYEAYETWKRTGRCYTGFGYIYEVATKKLKLFSLSEERKAAYLEEGKRRAAKHFRDRAFQRPMERHEMKRNVADALALAPGTDGRAWVRMEARQVALEEWFKSLDETGMDIGDMIWPDGRPADLLQKKTAT